MKLALVCILLTTGCARHVPPPPVIPALSMRTRPAFGPAPHEVLLTWFVSRSNNVLRQQVWRTADGQEWILLTDLDTRTENWTDFNPPCGLPLTYRVDAVFVDQSKAAVIQVGIVACQETQ